MELRALHQPALAEPALALRLEDDSQTHNPGPEVSKLRGKAPFYYQFGIQLSAHKSVWARKGANCYHTMTQ